MAWGAGEVVNSWYNKESKMLRHEDIKPGVILVDEKGHKRRVLAASEFAVNHT